MCGGLSIKEENKWGGGESVKGRGGACQKGVWTANKRWGLCKRGVVWRGQGFHVGGGLEKGWSWEHTRGGAYTTGAESETLRPSPSC